MVRMTDTTPTTDASTLIAAIHEQRLIGMHILADWWLAQFATPKFDNGDPSFQGFVAQHLAETLASASPVDNANDIRDTFRAAFIKAAQPTEPNEHGRIRWESRFHTDYHPDRVLATAMAAVFIKESRAPWKTNTSVSGSGLVVEVSAGYGSPFRTLYVAPIVDRLAELSDYEIDGMVPDQDERYRLDLSGAVDKAVRSYSHYAMTGGDREGRGPRRDPELVRMCVTRMRGLIIATA